MCTFQRHVYSKTHIIQLYEGVLSAADTLSQVGTGKATAHPVRVQVFHRQREVLGAVHTGPITERKSALYHTNGNIYSSWSGLLNVNSKKCQTM